MPLFPPLLAVSTGVVTSIIVALLLGVAVAMTLIAVWLVRRTRRDVPALGPLEVIADRSWRKSAGETRLELLAQARPAGARPPAPMLDFEPDRGPEDPTPPDDERPDGSSTDLDAEPAPETDSRSDSEPERESESESTSEQDAEPETEAEPASGPADAVVDEAAGIEVTVLHRYDADHG